LITRIITYIVPSSANALVVFSLRLSRGQTRVSAMPIDYTLLENDRTIWTPQIPSVADCNPITSLAKMV